MIHSHLMQILQRLNAMINDHSGPHQVREFFQYGVPVCKVTYQQETGEFIIDRYRPDRNLVFDDADLAAIEIYDCLYDFRHSF